MKVEIDYKNIILKDKLDSIHTFIFHSIGRRNSPNVFRNGKCKYDEENISELTHVQATDERKQIIWENIPETIECCNVEQVLWIINNDIFVNLNDKNRNNLISHKSKITKYIQENHCDGAILHNMNRKDFMKILAAYLGNKKLKISLGALYNAVIKYDMQKLLPNEEQTSDATVPNQSQHINIQQADIDQIAYIAKHVIENQIGKLNEHKETIIQYIKENKINGYKLVAEGKEFVNKIAVCLNDNKLKVLLEILYKNIMECDVSMFTSINIDEITKPDNLPSNNKFETQMTLSKEHNSYYSFGVQYRYTNNLEQHPFYVKSTYDSLKQELLQYFRFIQNKEKDAGQLLESQLERVKSFEANTNLQPILRKFIQDPEFSDLNWIQNDAETNVNYFLSTLLSDQSKIFQDCSVGLWMDEIESKHDDKLSSLLQIEEQRTKQLASVISNLCCSLSEDNQVLNGTNFTSIVFFTLLKMQSERFQKIKQIITQSLVIRLHDLSENVNEREQFKMKTYHCDEHKQYVEECDGCNSAKNFLQYVKPWTQIEFGKKKKKY
eukprot:355942_1